MSLFDSASLVVTPNGYKEDKLYSIKPTDGSGDLVVTRATTATRVNSAGLIEQVPYNLVQQSETFNTTWTAYNGATITSNAITAPNGTTTADLLIAGATQEIYSANMPKAAEELFFTFSCYAKFYNTNVFQMVCSDFSTSGVFVNFNLSTLSVTYSTGATWSNTTASMESVGNGWYRCIFTSKSPSTTGLYLSLLTTGTNSVSGVYIWGAQVVQGTSAKEYFPTTDRLNVPRLDYTNSSCPSILVEPQRTNLVTYSEQFDNAAWVKTQLTVTANATISPSGLQNADKLIPSNVNSFHNLYNFAAALTGSYVFSVFAKKGGYNFLNLQDQFGGIFNSCFDLNNGTFTTYAGSASIKSFDNDWYLCTVIGSGSGVTVIPSIIPSNSTSSFPIFVGNGTDGIFVWGAQFEAGSYATSYIPTIASSVTRNADVISKTGISSLLPQETGTMYVEFDWQKTFDDTQVISIGNNSNNLVWILKINSTTFSASFFMGGFIGPISVNVPSNLTTIKAVYSWANNDQVLYINGSQAGTNNGAITSSPNNFLLEFNAFWNILKNGTYIKAAALWKTRLTNDELAQLTTL